MAFSIGNQSSSILSQSSHNSQQEAFRFKFAVNTRGKDKNWDYKALAANFQDKEGTIYDVIHHVAQGHALCAGLLGGKWRAKRNVTGSWVVLGDVDNSRVVLGEDSKPARDENGHTIKEYDPQLTLEQAKQHPFIQQYCSLIYTTASHCESWNKFRLVFILPQQVDADTVECLTRHLMQLFPQLDPACKDSSRVFYGSTKASFPLVQPNAVLPQSWIDDAIATAQKEKQEYEQRIKEIEERRQQLREVTEAEGWDIDQLIWEALNHIPPRSPGSGNYEECLKVLMALNAHYGASEGEAIAESWSPSIKGTTWNIRAKFKSFRGRSQGIGIGTLFHIAKQYGFRFPERKQSYDHETRDRIISKQEWQVGKVKADLSTFKELASKAVASIKAAFRGFGTAPEVKANQNANVNKTKIIIYEPGNLPLRSEVTADVKVQCKADQHTLLWIEAVSKGWYLILDNSHPGLGKSYQSGTLTAAQFGVDKLIYQDVNHRNPSTSTIEEFFKDLPVRNNGFKVDEARKTPLGESFKVWPAAWEEVDTQGNCHRTYLFGAFRDKNFNTLDFEDSSESPICGGCPLSNQCKFASGPGFGFRHEKRTAIKNYSELRAHPDSTPTILFGEGEKIYNSGRIWEEAGVLLRSVRSIEVKLADFDTTVGKLALNAPAELVKLQPVLQILRGLLSQDIKANARYGFDDAGVRDELPDFPEDLDLKAIQEALEPDLKFLEDLDTIDTQGDRELRKSAAARYAAKELTKSSARQNAKDFLDLPLLWLPDFLEAWKGEDAFTCNHGTLTIYRKETKHQELVKSAQFNIFLDATLTVEMLRLKLGTDTPILVIEQERPKYDNLIVTGITGLGKLGKDRSPSLTARVNALKSKFREMHSSLGILDWKAIAEDSELKEYGHFVDGRGVNRFSDCDAIASFGIPYQNIGVLKAEFKVMGGRPEDFQAYVEQLVRNEILQEAGRLRSHRCPEKKREFYFAGDFDLSFLREELPGVQLKTVDAFQITPEAGTRSQQTGKKIIDAIAKLRDAGKEIGQNAVKSITGISQAWVSEFTQRFGGWKKFLKISVSLLDRLYSKTDIFSGDITEEELFLAEEYFPLLLAHHTPEEILVETSKVLDCEGVKAFERILDHASEDVRVGLLVAAVRSLPLEIQQIFDFSDSTEQHCLAVSEVVQCS